MTSKRFIYFIVGAFITGNLLLIFLQFNSAKNIDDLVDGNEKLLNEFKVGNELHELEKDVISIENKIRGMVVTMDTIHVTGLASQVAKVQVNLNELQKITNDNISSAYIDELDALVREKLKLGDRILDTFYTAGKTPAEAFMALPRGKELTDTIGQVIQKIDSNRQLLLTQLTSSIDKSGQDARRWGAILIVVVLLSGAGLFWYVINKIRRQNQLIAQLDRSERKVREAAQVKENFMANMSHEIRTPMNAILGFTGLLQKKNLDAETKEYIWSIERSGENLLTIINDILDLSKIEAGMLRIESAPFSLYEVIGFIEAMFTVKAKEKQLRFVTQLDADVPDMLDGDAVRLTQILVNLVGNAIKFTQQGEVTLHVAKNDTNNTRLSICFTIKDTGIGINKDKIAHIFERFEQGEESITRRYGGTGLGLSIVRELILLQQGDIQVESEPDTGSVFRFVLPYTISDHATAQKTQAKLQPEIMARANKIVILVVEDNEMNQRLMAHLLKGWDISFEIAANGKEALSQVDTASYDLILMDIQMPEMDGYTATQLLREKGIGIPIIAMTAHAWTGEREKCIRYGMNDYLSKPIKEQELLRLISLYTHLEKKEPVQKSVPGKSGHYQYIDLHYMQEVSGGNKEYEQAVTGQFLEMIPQDLQQLESAFKENNFKAIRSISHNMKTSVSIMGLTEKLQPALDLLEESHDEQLLADNIALVKKICLASLTEARRLYESLLS